MNIPFPSESFIENYVIEKLKTSFECPVNGGHFDFSLQQVDISPYGIIDILKFQFFKSDENEYVICLTVLELKNENLKGRHLTQLARYCQALRRYASYYQAKIPNLKIKVRGELAGPVDKNSDIIFMPPCLYGITMYDLSCDVDNGFTSEKIGKGWSMNAEKKTDMRKIARLIYSLHKDNGDLF